MKKRGMILIFVVLFLMIFFSINFIFSAEHTLQIIGQSPTVAEAPVSTGGTSLSWYKTIINPDNDYEAIQKELGYKERIEIKVNNEKHYVGVISLNSNSAIIQVMSNPQNISLNVSDEKKVDVNNDYYYDLSVRLNSIYNNKANITITKINEKIQENIDNNSINNPENPSVVTGADKTSNAFEWGNAVFYSFIIGIIILVCLIINHIRLKKNRGINF